MSSSRLTAGGASPDILVKDVSTRDLDSVRVGELTGKINQGEGNVFVGYQSGQNLVNGNYDTFVGFQAGNASVGSSYTTFVGAQCGAQNVTGNEIVGVGYKALEYSVGASQATAIGAYAMQQNVSGIASVAVGYRAGENMLDGQNNTILGTEAAQNMRTGNNNTIQGYQAGRAAFAINDNAYFGAYAGYCNSSGTGNCFFGYKAGYELMDGNCNVGLGAYALYFGSNVNNTVAIGPYAGGGGSGGTGSNNGSGGSNGSGAGGPGATESVILGTFSACNGAPQQSVVIGTSAAVSARGAGSVLIGYAVAPTLSSGGSNILIGVGADTVSPDTSNAISIGSIGSIVAADSISIGNAIANSRHKSVLVGFSLSANADNTVIVGLDNKVESVNFFNDPLSLDYQANVAQDAAVKFGATAIDYTNLLVSPCNEINPVAQAVYYCKTLSNNESNVFIPHVPASINYDLTTQTPVYALVQGRFFKIATDQQYQELLSSNQNIFALASSNVSDSILRSSPGLVYTPIIISYDYTNANSNILNLTTIELPLNFALNSRLPTINIVESNTAVENVQVSVTKRVAPPSFPSQTISVPICIPPAPISLGSLLSSNVTFNKTQGFVYPSCNITYIVSGAPAIGTLNSLTLTSNTWPDCEYTVPVENTFASSDTIQINARLVIDNNVNIPSTNTSTKQLNFQLNDIHLLTNAIYFESDQVYSLGKKDIITTDAYTVPEYIPNTFVFSNITTGIVYNSNQIARMSNENMWNYTPDKLGSYLTTVNTQITADIVANIQYTSNAVFPYIDNILQSNVILQSTNTCNLVKAFKSSILPPKSDVNTLMRSYNQMSNAITSTDNTNMDFVYDLGHVYAAYFTSNTFAQSWVNLQNFSTQVAAVNVNNYSGTLPTLSSIAPPSYSNLINTLNYKYLDTNIPRLFITPNDIQNSHVVLSNTSPLIPGTVNDLIFHNLGMTQIYTDYRTFDNMWTTMVTPEILSQTITVPYSNINARAMTYSFAYPPGTDSSKVFIEKYPANGIITLSGGELFYNLYNPRMLAADSFKVVFTNATGQNILADRSVAMDTTTRVLPSLDIMVFPQCNVQRPTITTIINSNIISNPLYNTDLLISRGTSVIYTPSGVGSNVTCNIYVSNISVPTSGACNLFFTSSSYVDLTQQGIPTPIIQSNLTYTLSGVGLQAYSQSNTIATQLVNIGTGSCNLVTSYTYTCNISYSIPIGSAEITYINNSNITETTIVVPISGSSNTSTSNIVIQNIPQAPTTDSNVTSDQAYNSTYSYNLLVRPTSSFNQNSNINIYNCVNTSNYRDTLTGNTIYTTNDSYTYRTTDPFTITNTIQTIATYSNVVHSNLDIYQSFAPLTSYHVSKTCNEIYTTSATALRVGPTNDIQTVIRSYGPQNQISVQDIEAGNVFVRGSYSLTTTYTLTLATQTGVNYSISGRCIQGSCNAVVPIIHNVPVEIDPMTQIGSTNNTLADVCSEFTVAYNSVPQYLHVYSVGADCCVLDATSNISTLVDMNVGFPLFFANNRYSSNEIWYYLTDNYKLVGYNVSPLYRATFYTDQSPFATGTDFNLSPFDLKTSLGSPEFYYSRSGSNPTITAIATGGSGTYPVAPSSFTTQTVATIQSDTTFNYNIYGNGVGSYQFRTYVYNNFPLSSQTEGLIKNIQLGSSSFSNVLTGNVWNVNGATGSIMIDDPKSVPGFFWSSNYPGNILQKIPSEEYTSNNVHFVPYVTSVPSSTVQIRLLDGLNVSPAYTVGVKNYISIFPANSNLSNVYLIPRLSPDLVADGFQWTASESSDGRSNIYSLTGSGSSIIYTETVPAVSYTPAPSITTIRNNTNLVVDQANCISIKDAIMSCFNGDMSDLTFYISANPQYGVLTTYRFTYPELAMESVLYRHIGNGTADDVFTVAFSSNPFDVCLTDITVNVTVRPIPVVTLNALGYIYLDDLYSASNLNSNITASSLTVTGLSTSTLGSGGYIHILPQYNCNLDTRDLVFSNVSDIVYQPHPEVFQGRTPPYEHLSFSFITSGDSNTINPLIISPTYSNLFLNTYTLAVNEHIAVNQYIGGQADIQHVKYSIGAISDLKSERTVTFSVYVKPTWDLVNQQLRSYQTQTMDIRIVDATGTDIIRFNILGGYNTSTLQLQRQDESSGWSSVVNYPILPGYVWTQIVLINNDLSPDGLYNQLTIKVGGANVYTGPALNLTTIGELLVEFPVTDPANLQFQNASNIVVPINGSHDSNMKYSFQVQNFRTIYEVKQLEIQISKYDYNTNNYDATTHNIVIGQSINVRGDGNLCLGNEFSTSGTNNIILGNSIGVQTNSAPSEIYQAIVIGNSNFTNSTVNNIICVGNNNLGNLINLDQTAVQHFMSKNPIIIGNSIASNMIDFYVNVADVLLKTDLPTTGPEQIYIGLNNEVVRIGYTSNIGTSGSVTYDLDVAGTIRAKTLQVDSLKYDSSSTGSNLNTTNLTTSNITIYQTLSANVLSGSNIIISDINTSNVYTSNNTYSTNIQACNITADSMTINNTMSSPVITTSQLTVSTTVQTDKITSLQNNGTGSIDLGGSSISNIQSVSTLAMTSPTSNIDMAGVTLINAIVRGSLAGTASNVGYTLNAGNYILGSPFDGSVRVTWNINATSLNTLNTVVSRDASGNFAAGTITATLSGTATRVGHSLTAISGGYILGSSTYDGSAQVNWAINATYTNISNAIVARDSAGNFSAGIITANLNGTASNVQNTLNAGTYLIGSPFDGSAKVTWTVNATSLSTSNTVVSRDASGNFVAQVVTAALNGNATSANKVNASIYPGTGLVGTPFDGSGAVTWVTNSTSSNSSNTLVSRDLSGNFAAGTITATLNGTASNAARVTYAIYPGTGLSGAIFNGNAAVTWSVISTNSNGSNIIVSRDASGNFAAGIITATLYGTATNTSNSIYPGTGLSGAVFNGSTAVTWSVISTSANAAEGIVSRDASGNFSAGVVIATLSGVASTATRTSKAIYPGAGLFGPSFDGSAAVTWSVISTTANSAGGIVTRDASGNFSAGVVTATLNGTASNVNNAIYPGVGLSGAAFDGSAAVMWTVISTSANVPGGIVSRDASGNFSAGVVTATLLGTASNVNHAIYPGVGLSGSTFDGSAAVTWSVISTSANVPGGIISRDASGNFSARVVTATLLGTASNVNNAIYSGVGLYGPSFDGSAAVTWSVISTSANTPGGIVSRDASGNFSAGVITATLLGTASNIDNAIYPGVGLSGAAFDGSAAVTWSVISTSANTAGSIVSRDAFGNFSAGVIIATLSGVASTATRTSNAIYPGVGLSGSSFDGSAGVTWSVISTSANTVGSIVSRDASGNFSAGVVTATLFGTASNVGNVIYPGVGLSGSTFDGSAAVTWSVISTSANTAGSIVSRDASGNFSAGVVSATNLNVDSVTAQGTFLNALIATSQISGLQAGMPMIFASVETTTGLPIVKTTSNVGDPTILGIFGSNALSSYSSLSNYCNVSLQTYGIGQVLCSNTSLYAGCNLIASSNFGYAHVATIPLTYTLSNFVNISTTFAKVLVPNTVVGSNTSLSTCFIRI